MKEVWVSVKTNRGNYEISNCGRLRKYVTKHGDTPVIICGGVTTQGYRVFYLSGKQVWGHRLVAKYFIENKLNHPCVNHKNGNKLDNVVDNLEWCSYSENSIHAFRIGLKKPLIGEMSNRAKLKEKEVLDIYKSKEKTSFLSEKYKVDQSIIFDIKSGNTWKHLTGGLNVMSRKKILSNYIIMSIYNEDMPTNLVAQKYGVAKSTVKNIRNGNAHVNITKHKFK